MRYLLPMEYSAVDSAGITARRPDCRVSDRAFSVPKLSGEGEISLIASCTPALH